LKKDLRYFRGPRLILGSPPELQGHAIKNKDLLTASGAITLKGPESYEELEEDIQAVSPLVPL
jgi:hypothetical protein